MMYLSTYNSSELSRRLVQALAIFGLMYVIYTGTNWSKATYSEYLMIWVCEFIAFGLFCVFVKDIISLITIEHKQLISRSDKQ